MTDIEITGSRIIVRGDLSVDTAAGLYRDTPVFNQSSYEVDLQMVDKCDSAGLALLVHWSADAARSSSRLSFSNVPAALQEIARLGGLEGIISDESDND